MSPDACQEIDLPPPPPEKTDDQQQSQRQYWRQCLFGFLTFQLLGTVVATVLVSLVVGFVHHPMAVGTFSLLPYYCFAFVSNSSIVACAGAAVVSATETSTTTRREAPFSSMRAFLQLKLEVDGGGGGGTTPPEQSPKRYTTTTPMTSRPRLNDHPNLEQPYIFAVFPHGINAEYRPLMDGTVPHEFLEGPQWRRHLVQQGPSPLVTRTAKIEPADDENKDGAADGDVSAGGHQELDDDSDNKQIIISLPTRTLAASILFWIPIVREVALLTGCIPATRSVADTLLHSRRCNVMVLPGGQQEQIRTECGHEKVWLAQRKGFVRLALRHGIPVVPVYVFGATDYYRTKTLLGPAGFKLRQLVLRAFGAAIPPFYWGFAGSICCPRPVPTTAVFGRPLNLHSMSLPPLTTVSKDCGGSEDDGDDRGEKEERRVEVAHAAFTEALVELFERNKERLGYGDRTLLVE